MHMIKHTTIYSIFMLLKYLPILMYPVTNVTSSMRSPSLLLKMWLLSYVTVSNCVKQCKTEKNIMTKTLFLQFCVYNEG